MRTISVSYSPPPELVAMMFDFRDMANHLIAYALAKRLDSAFDLRDENYRWFEEHYSGRYAVHYLHSAASYAMGVVKAWRKVGKSKLPHLYRPMARLDQMLVKIKRKDVDGIRLQITLAPRHFATLDLPIRHRRWADWRGYGLGEITVRPDSIELPFQTPEPRAILCEHSAGIDLNMGRAVVATSDGQMHEVNLRPVVSIQKRMRRKRESIQSALPRNLEKQRKLLRRLRRRERNRIEHLLHAKAREVLRAIGDRNIVLEDLHATTPDCLRDCAGRKFRAKLSSWPHGRLQLILSRNARTAVLTVSARGTSSHDPFCGQPVAHPEWRQSFCPTHGLYDRDRLAAVAVLERGQRALRGKPFTPSVVASLQKQSALGYEETSSLRARHENRDDAMNGDAPNVSAESYRLLPR